MRDSKAAEATMARIYEMTFSLKKANVPTLLPNIEYLGCVMPYCFSASLHLALLGHGMV